MFARSELPNYLNLGCGDRFHPDWTNLDFNSNDPHVRVYDLAKGLPFSDSAFEVVYLSHVLEHFSESAGLNLVRECHRVLRGKGIVRVVVPDLEQIATLYLQELSKVETGATDDSSAYDWMRLELFDQMVREKPGGEIAEFIQRADTNALGLARERLGGEMERIRSSFDSAKRRQTPTGAKNRGLSRLQRKLLRLMGGPDAISAYDAGRFRLSGEVHLCMYDGFSLARALERAQFRESRSVQADESSIPDWTSFNLDTEPDGRIYKPDSLYMEATRP